MMNCEVARDLLPLYEDGAVSPVTQSLLREHLKECPECRSYYAVIRRRAHTFFAPETPAKYRYSEVARKIRSFRIAEAAAAGLIVAAAGFAFVASLTDKDGN